MIDENRADAAVFFDFENIAYSLRLEFNENPNFEALMDKCQEYGRVVLARAYANWGRHTSVIAPLQASGFDPVYVPSYFYSNQEKTTRKNAVDIHMAIEAIETIHSRPHVSVYIILTGDKDFIPLANALRRHGKQVVALGVKGTTSPYLQQAVDDFIFYHQVLDDPVQKKSDENVYDVLVKAIQQLQTQKDDTILPRIKHTMSELLDGFDEKKHKDAHGNHFRKFKDFIREAQRLGYIHLETTGTENRVYLAGNQKTTEPKKEKGWDKGREKEKERKRPSQTKKPAPASMSLEDSFDLLSKAVTQTEQAKKSLRASHIKTVMRNLQPGFDEKQVVGKDGKKFTRFTEFARAAEDKGVVRIVGKGMGTEIHPASINGRSTSEPEADAMEPSEPAEEPAPSPELITEPLVVEPPVAESASVEPVVAEQATVTPAIVEPPIAWQTLSPRRFFLEALRTFHYPAQIQTLLDHCSEVRDAHQRQDLSDREVRQLLAVAVQGSLLQRTSGPEPRQVYLVLDSSETAVSRFLGE